MDYTQNAKIAQVTEKTLIIDVGIDSESHYARAFKMSVFLPPISLGVCTNLLGLM